MYLSAARLEVTGAVEVKRRGAERFSEGVSGGRGANDPSIVISVTSCRKVFDLGHSAPFATSMRGAFANVCLASDRPHQPQSPEELHDSQGADHPLPEISAHFCPWALPLYIELY
jgi:hypothetical protein